MTSGHNLKLQETSLSPGSEWHPPADCWSLVRLKSGVAYWLQTSTPRELGVTDVVMAAGSAVDTVRASQLGPATLQWFTIQPETLGGVLTWNERNHLAMLAGRPESAGRYFPAGHEIAHRFERLTGRSDGAEFQVRCQLLELWAAALDQELKTATAPSVYADAKERFRQLIGQIPEAELQDRSIDELAGLLRCSPRHLSRLFHETFGVSLRTKQTELRLLKARRLLADSNEKVINVAMDSGYRHLGLFNSMFKKRFGMTPSEWRRSSVRQTRPRPGARLVSRLAMIGLAIGLLLGRPANARATEMASTPAPVTNPASSGTVA